MGEIAATISAICAAISAFLAWRIIVKSDKLMRISQRPIISLLDTEAVMKLSTMHVGLNFKNTGTHTAGNVRVRVFGCPKQKTLQVEGIGDKQVMNQKDPGITFSWTRLDIDNKNKTDFMFYVEVRYTDIITTKKYRNGFRLIYKKGERSLHDMDIPDWIKMRNNMPWYRAEG